MFTSIKVKIIAIISTFFAIVLFLNTLYSLDKSKIQLTKYLDNLNQSSAKILVENIRGYFYNLNYQKIKKTLDTFDNEYFKNIYVLNYNGYIFAQREENKIIYKKYKNFDKLKKLNEKEEFRLFKPIIVSNNIIGYLVIENNDMIYHELEKERRDEIFRLFFVLLVITILISYFISMIITKPIDKIILNIKKINEQKDFDFEHTNDEYGYLSRIIEQNHKNIQNLNNNLQKLVKDEIKKNKNKDKILQEQSVRASMGEMMDAVAHQWVQPLSVIKMHMQDLELKSEFSTIKHEDMQSASKNTYKQISHMTETLDEFRSFFRINKKPEKVFLCKTIKLTLELLKDDLQKNNIQVNFDSCYSQEVAIIPNEFKHVLINVLNNAKDAFVSKKIENRIIDIKIYEKDSKVLIDILDNAGGIDEEIINHIFEINISSKEKDKGTGIGLYISRLIIHKIDGEIEASNKEDGSCFTISLPL